MSRTRINREEEIALLDDLSVPEIDFGKCAADLSTQLHFVHG